MALPDSWPIFHGCHLVSVPTLGVNTGGPTQRQGGQELCVCSHSWAYPRDSAACQRHSSPCWGPWTGPKGPQFTPKPVNHSLPKPISTGPYLTIM
jgi:hypothetical protein